MIKTFLKTFITLLVLSSITLYIFSIKEGMEVLEMEGGYFKNIPKTFEYFFYWVVPFWWFILIIFSLVLSFLSILIKKVKWK